MPATRSRQSSAKADEVAKESPVKENSEVVKETAPEQEKTENSIAEVKTDIVDEPKTEEEAVKPEEEEADLTNSSNGNAEEKVAGDDAKEDKVEEEKKEVITEEEDEVSPQKKAKLDNTATAEETPVEATA